MLCTCNNDNVSCTHNNIMEEQILHDLITGQVLKDLPSKAFIKLLHPLMLLLD